ncbi:MAG TPA: hypothetical protein VGY56_21740 [Verrucomicrobiae bacterium]|nr:hypothetical protein [Verrucomicrobiae bacterium]
MNNTPKALALSRRAMVLLNEEIDRHKRGLGTIGTHGQLENSKQQLTRMITQLESGSLPPKDQRLVGMGHMVADSWPVDAKLGEALLLAEQAYRSAP